MTVYGRLILKSCDRQTAEMMIHVMSLWSRSRCHVLPAGLGPRPARGVPRRTGRNRGLSAKTPSKKSRLPGVTAKEFNREVLDMLLKMLNIVHTRQTLVGNAFVRGVSGGERKRVSILEMMATRAHVVSYDNSTRGLDASTAVR